MLPGSEPRPWPCQLEATSDFRFYSHVRCMGRPMAHPPWRNHYPPSPLCWPQVRRNSLVVGRQTEFFIVLPVPPWITASHDPAPVSLTLSPPPILSWARQARELNGTLFSSYPNLVDAAAHGHTMRSLILTRWLASQANSSPSRRWEGDLVGNATTDCYAHDKRSDRLDLRAAHLPSHSLVMVHPGRTSCMTI